MVSSRVLDRTLRPDALDLRERRREPIKGGNRTINLSNKRTEQITYQRREQNR